MDPALAHPPLWTVVGTAWVVLGALVGVMIGWWRNRLLRAALMGAALGPIGWWLVARMPGRFIECPACSRRIRVQARTCAHCGADVLRSVNRSARSSLKGTDSAKGPW